MQKSLLKTTILLLILVSPRDYTNANDQIEKPELKIKILVDISEQRLYPVSYTHLTLPTKRIV